MSTPYWALTPEDLIGVDVVWLLRLEFAGKVWRYAASAETVTEEDGTAYPYMPGLDFGGTVEIASEPGGGAAVPLSASVVVHVLGSLDVKGLERDGHDAGSMSGRLYWWPRGSATQALVIDGVCRGVTYDASEDAVSFELEQTLAEERRRYPANTARVSGKTFAAAPKKVLGERYPDVFGVCGNSDDDRFGWSGLLVQSGGGDDRLLVAGHVIDASEVFVRNKDDANGFYINTTEAQDLLGQTYTYCQLSGTSVTVATDAEYYCRFRNTSAGGHKSRDKSEAMRGAGDHVRYWAARSSLNFDRGALEAVIPRMNTYLIDAAAVGSPEQRIRPAEWIREVLDLLPVSDVLGPNGIELAWWDFDAPEVVADISMDRGDAVQLSPAEKSERDDVVTTFRMAYGYDALEDRLIDEFVLTGDESVIRKDDNAVENAYCRMSYARYGEMGVWEGKSELVQDPATAGRVCQWRAAAMALQHTRVTVDAQRRFAFLRQGDAVALTSAALGLTARIAYVDSVGLSDRGSVELGFRLYDNPARDF